MSPGGSTNWSVSIPAMLARLGTMDSGQAGKDAKALAEAINQALDAARLLYTFGRDDLKGEAAAASEATAQKIFSDITSAASAVTPGVGALTSAQNGLETALEQKPILEGWQMDLNDPNRHVDAADIMTRAANLMTESYNPPMGSAANQAPDPPTSTLSGGPGAGGVVGGGAGGAGGSSGAGGGGGRTSAGNASDMGEFGSQPNGTPSATAAADPTGPGPGPAGPSGGSDSSDQSGRSGNSSGSGADGPEGLDRGGRGSPADPGTGNGTVPAGMPLGVGGPGGSSGSAAGRGGGLGGAGGGSGASVAELSRRMSAGVSATNPTPNSTTPVGAGQGRGGSSPMGGAPHAGGKGKAGEDTKHKTAHYLHTRDNGEEVVGSLPLVGPPVIGDWAPSGQAAEVAAPESDPDNPDKALKLD